MEQKYIGTYEETPIYAVQREDFIPMWMQKKFDRNIIYCVLPERLCCKGYRVVGSLNGSYKHFTATDGKEAIAQHYEHEINEYVAQREAELAAQAAQEPAQEAEPIVEAKVEEPTETSKQAPKARLRHKVVKILNSDD